jgi:flavin-dependent thymidylate synthase
MKVTLFDYTGADSHDPSRYAANILLFTKSTRLNMTPALMREIEIMKWEEIKSELEKMADTLPSSWEFINFSFLIEGVTRAFTHQLVRTRHASYAQQAMRIVDMSDFEYATGPSIKGNRLIEGAYKNTMDNSAQCYKFLIESGARTEDARGVLPTNILTNICIKIDMRNFINLVRKRSSLRVQDEYRNILDLMIIEVERVYPWFYIFYKNDEFKAMKDLSDLIWENKNLTSEEKSAMIKKVDILRKEI